MSKEIETKLPVGQPRLVSGCGADWTPNVEKLVRVWRDMSAAEMRLRCGELTAQEIRTLRAVLNQILPSNV